MSRALSVFHGPFGRASLYELDRPLIRHAHREAHLIFFVGGTRGHLKLGNDSFLMDEDTAAAINPWEAHGFAPGDSRKPGYFLTFYFNPHWLRKALPDRLTASRLFNSNRIAVSHALRQSRDDICDMLLNGVPGQTDFSKMLERLLTNVETEPDRKMPSAVRPAWSGLDFRLRRSLKALAPGMLADCSLESIARSSGLSRAHFFSLFRQQVGVTPVVYVNTLRIENALDQISHTQVSITAIGDGLGFSCQSAFTRFFSSHVGMPPTDYRRAVQVFGVPANA